MEGLQSRNGYQNFFTDDLHDSRVSWKTEFPFVCQPDTPENSMSHESNDSTTLLSSEGNESLDAKLLLQGLEAFNQATLKLQQYYRGIEQKVDELNSELARKNRELEQNLLEKERVRNYLSNIFESSAIGILVTDLNGQLTSINPTALRLLNRYSDEVQGKHANDIFQDKVIPRPLTAEAISMFRRARDVEVIFRKSCGFVITIKTLYLFNARFNRRHFRIDS